MQGKWRAKFRQGQAAHAERRRMSSQKPSSTSSSSPTPMDTESSLMNFLRLDGTLINPEGRLESLSISNGTGSDSPDTSSESRIETEDECEVHFTIIIRSFGVYERVEHNIARTVSHALYRNYFDRYEMYDEIGRKVVFNDKAPHGSDEQIFVVEKPS